MPLPARRDKHRNNLRKWATHKLLEPVPPCARQEHNQGKNDRARANSITPFSPQVVLNVHKNCHSAKRAYAYEEEEPTEKICHSDFFFFV